MCKSANKRGGIIEEILEEFGNNMDNVVPLTKQEIEDILIEYEGKNFTVGEFDDSFYEEFFEKDAVRLSEEEME